MKQWFFVLYFMLQVVIGNGQEYTGNNEEVKRTILLFKDGKNLETILACDKNIAACIKQRDSSNLGIFISIKGFVYLDTISQDSALQLFETAFTIGLKTQEYHAIYRSLYGLGKYYYRNSNFETSNKYFYLLNYYAEKQKNKYYTFVAYYYLSANYNLLSSPYRTMHYARLASQMAFELKDTASYIKSIVSIGGRYLVNGNLDSAEVYFKKSESTYNKYSDKNKSIGSDIFNGLMKLHNLRKQYSQAIYYGRLAIADALKSGYEQEVNIYYDNISVAYSNLKQYDSAIYYINKALVLEKKFNYVDEYKADLKELSALYKLTNSNDKALEFLEKYVQADSMYKPVNNYLVDSLKSAFEAEKNAIALKVEKEKIEGRFREKQKYFYTTLIIVTLVITMLVYILYSRYKLKKEKEKQVLFIQAKESEIKALQAQMNPHFIFNSLNSVLEFIRKSHNEEAIAYLTKFTKLIRMVLEYSEKKSILLKDELDFLKLYSDLENLRFNNNFTCSIQVSPELDIYTTEIPSMITQPFIENAIIHGLQNKYSLLNESNIKFNGDLKIAFSEEGDFVKCTIEDNGIGRPKAEEIKQSKLSSHKSMGMRITKDRLSILSERKCEVNFVDLTDNNGNSTGTRAIILIPVNNNF